MRSFVLASALGLTAAFAPTGVATSALLSARSAVAPVMMARAPPKAAPAKKAPAKKVAPKAGKVAPTKKSVPARKPVPARKAPARKAPARKAPAPAKKAPAKSGPFAYGLPGNINIIGGQELNWDPYGFLDGKSKLEVYRYRECELTHGRVGMLAAVGFIVQVSCHAPSSLRTFLRDPLPLFVHRAALSPPVSSISSPHP